MRRVLQVLFWLAKYALSVVRRMPNVLLSSHATNASPRCWKAVHENSIAMLCESLAPFRHAGRDREVA